MKDEFNYEFENFQDFFRFSLFSVAAIVMTLFSEVFEKSKSLVKEFLG